MKYLTFPQLQAARNVGRARAKMMHEWESKPYTTRTKHRVPPPKLNLWRSIMGGEDPRSFEPDAWALLDEYFQMGVTDFEKTLMPGFQLGDTVVVGTGRRFWTLSDVEVGTLAVWVKVERRNRANERSTTWVRLSSIRHPRERLSAVA